MEEQQPPPRLRSQRAARRRHGLSSRGELPRRLEHPRQLIDHEGLLAQLLLQCVDLRQHRE